MKVNYGTSNSLNYSKTLYEWTLAALVTEGKIEITCSPDGTKKFTDLKDRNLAPRLEYAKRQYKTALDALKISPTSNLKQFVENKVLDACFEMDETMFPIALSEGILDLKDVIGRAMSGMNGLSIDQEPEQQR
ncbi:MAG: hypothetical protein PHV83_07825 [Bacteroidales bacterium]|nr:hypothetical protein [Bacteroidales bacterium]